MVAFFVAIPLDTFILPVEETTYQIESFHDSERYGGSFILGTGSANSNAVFYVYRETPHGWLLVQLPAEITYIVEDNTSHPYAVEERTMFFRHQIRWTIHVPAGAIVEEYKLDGEP